MGRSNEHSDRYVKPNDVSNRIAMSIGVNGDAETDCENFFPPPPSTDGGVPYVAREMTHHFLGHHFS